jgi:hypothetical protein
MASLIGIVLAHHSSACSLLFFDPARDTRGDGDLWDYCVDDPINCVDPWGLEGEAANSEKDTLWNNPASRILKNQLASTVIGAGRGFVSGGGTGAVIGGGTGFISGTISGVAKEVPVVKKAIPQLKTDAAIIGAHRAEWEGDMLE